MIVVSIPLPPSANRLWRAVRGRTKPTIAPAYAAWKREAGVMLDAARVDAVVGAFDIAISIPTKMRGDADNRIKPILDLMKTKRLTDDDRNAQTVSISRTSGVPAGMCVVTITKADSEPRDAGIGAAGDGRKGSAFASIPIPAP